MDGRTHGPRPRSREEEGVERRGCSNGRRHAASYLPRPPSPVRPSVRRFSSQIGAEFVQLLDQQAAEVHEKRRRRRTDGRADPARGAGVGFSLHFTSPVLDEGRRRSGGEPPSPPPPPPPPPLLPLSSASILSLLLLEELARRGAATGEWGWRAGWDYSAVDTLRITVKSI